MSFSTQEGDEDGDDDEDPDYQPPVSKADLLFNSHYKSEAFLADEDRKFDLDYQPPVSTVDQLFNSPYKSAETILVSVRRKMTLITSPPLVQCITYIYFVFSLSI